MRTNQGRRTFLKTVVAGLAAFGSSLCFSQNPLSAPSSGPNTEDEAAKLEAYSAWKRAGCPTLSKPEQDRMYFEALEKVRRTHPRAER